ncbi:MAG: hypothetical protein ACP5UI_01935 [Thermoprotei archaeon]|nr:hypothetical protein [TACK group archaeon]
MSRSGSSGTGGIRLRYSGIFIFAAKLSTTITGLIFMWILARFLPQSGFGGVYFISGILLYFTFPASVVPYWAAREIAVGKGGAKTSLAFNLLLSIPFFLGFLLLSPLLAAKGDVPTVALLAASPMVPLTFAISSFNNTVGVVRPAQLAGRDLAGDLVKIGFAVALVVVMKFGLPGAELSLSSAYVASAAYLYRRYREIEGQESRAEWRRALKWVALSWVTLLTGALSSFYAGADKLLLGLISEQQLGAYGAALLLSSQLSAVSGLSSALYPYVLRSGELEKGTRQVGDLTLMFSIPMLFGLLTFGRQLLSVLSRHYGVASLSLLPMLAAAYFITSSFYPLMDSVVLGSEKVDIAPRELRSSKFFGYLLLQALSLLVMLPIMWILALFYGALGMSVAVLAGAVLKLTGRFIIGKGKLKALFSPALAAKFITSSLLMSALLLILPSRGTMQVLLDVLMGAAVYFTVLIALDSGLRHTFVSGFRAFLRDEIASRHPIQSDL